VDGAATISGGNDTIHMTYRSHTAISYAKDDCGNIGASDPYTFVLGPGEAGSAYGSPSKTNTHSVSSVPQTPPITSTPLTSEATQASSAPTTATSPTVTSTNEQQTQHHLPASLFLVAIVLAGVLVGGRWYRYCLWK
jgi:hypothetical protein